jgi:hypothetical protein
LDFFVNDDAEYAEQLKIIFSKLKTDGFSWSSTKDFISTKIYTSLKVQWKQSDVLLKLDFVNDVASHFGDIKSTKLFNRIDSIRNMLSNKLTAVFRFAGKDIVDIREIALREQVNWKEAIQDAQQKEAGVEIPVISDILRGMPQSEFENIAWVKKPDWQEFQADIDRIVCEMISGEKASCVP